MDIKRDSKNGSLSVEILLKWCYVIALLCYLIIRTAMAVSLELASVKQARARDCSHIAAHVLIA